MAADDEFVTIVPVGEARRAPSPQRDPAFVTVLTVGAAAGAAEVSVRRPRGARLGLGLKFEGGSAAAEKVRRLMVQSCATDSPAAGASTPWGTLIPGDEILAIDGHPVSELTRIDCVRRLKESDETLKLLVRHLEEEQERSISPTAKPQEIQRPNLPPPVPPRKLNKKNSFKDRPAPIGDQAPKISEVNGTLTESGTQINGKSMDPSRPNKLSRKSSFDSHVHRQAKESLSALKKSSPEEVRRLVRRLSDGKAIPPEAEVYMDIISQEWERCLVFADTESDDTGSSISTVVDRLSSIASSVENSIPSTPTMQQKTIDIQKVLNCIENIDSDLLKDIATTRFADKSVDHTEKNSDIDEVDSGVSSIHKDIKNIDNKVVTNDKNNNNTIVRNVTCINIDTNTSKRNTEKPKCKPEIAIAKPKPLPRNSIFEQSHTTENETETIQKEEVLLTPTKKNCIENWLQRSEAELISKSAETLPEALPRLIDFVPKPQYRDLTLSVVPPKTIVDHPHVRLEPRVDSRVDKRSNLPPPPPPPVETREDGSGASLDTIGELDEGTDTTNTEESAESEKNVISCKKYESNYWQGHTTRSDAEDSKSLSNDESPPPTCPRQPPDGVETPSEAVEKTSETSRPESPAPPLPTSSPTALRLHSRHTPVWSNTTRPRVRTSYSRSQDARSECSVKDKIAMFSSDKPELTERVERCHYPSPMRPVPSLGKSNTSQKGFSEVHSLDRRLTKSQDNLDEVPRVERTYRHIDKRPEVLGGHNIPKTFTDCTDDTSVKFSDVGTSLHYGSTTNLSTKPYERSKSVYHSRSVSEDGCNASYKSTLEYLIEQRKKSMSKLRGLMIPEVHAPIPDLPEIKVQECNVFKNTINNNRQINQLNKEYNKKKSTPKTCLNLTESLNLNILPNNIPKYSPAFKRKSLQVYSTSSTISKESTPERRLNSPTDNKRSYLIENGVNKQAPTKPPRNSIDVKKSYGERHFGSVPSKVNLPGPLKTVNRIDKSLYDKYHEYGNVEVKVCTATDVVDSDNDSAVSSTQSSYRSSASSPLHNMDSVESDSSHLSPRSSHYISYSFVKSDTHKIKDPKINGDYEKINVCRTLSSETSASVSSSAGSAATSGSQASCSSLESSVTDSGKKKVTRTHSVDSMNRRNILASAKCRSGRDLNVGSPVVETKFNHESDFRTPSPQRKVSDRLTTLASSASGLSSKGDSRRTRSKVIADTDSDSENELNIRQRKSEFKNSRLKKNTNTQVPKVETKKKNEYSITDCIVAADDVPQVISQRIIKEIKKAGLHDIVHDNKVVTKNNASEVTIKHNIEEKKFENGHVNHADVKTEIVLTTKLNAQIVESPEILKTSTNTDMKNTDEVIVSQSVVSSYQVVLKKGIGAGVGLILAGGTDCEAKSVTVHKVLAGSVAERGGLQRGARVLSINGRAMANLTHAETVAVLKEPRSEVVIEIENEKTDTSSAEHSDTAESRTTEQPSSMAEDVVRVDVEKSGAGVGLGFGLDGGKDSPSGDRPLTVKKLFAGGAASKCGLVVVGAELLSAGGRDLRGLTRTQAWAALKQLPAGAVQLVLRNPR